MSISAKLIKDEDISHYESILKKYGFGINEFSFYEEFPDGMPSLLSSCSGVTIYCIANNKKRTYPVGIDYSWPSAFENDILNGYFK